MLTRSQGDPAMNKLTRTGFVLFSAGICAVIAVGLTASVAEAKRPGSGGGGTFCPDVWDPVICSNGQVYSNACYASRAGATGCVPYGPGGPVPI